MKAVKASSLMVSKLLEHLRVTNQEKARKEYYLEIEKRT